MEVCSESKTPLPSASSARVHKTSSRPPLRLIQIHLDYTVIHNTDTFIGDLGNSYGPKFCLFLFSCFHDSGYRFSTPKFQHRPKLLLVHTKFGLKLPSYTVYTFFFFFFLTCISRAPGLSLSCDNTCSL